MTEIPRSQFFGRDAQEVAQTYLTWYRRLLLRSVVAVIAVGIAAIASLYYLDNLLLYFVGLGAIVCLGVSCRLRVNKEFRALAGIINTDCDVAKWRYVIEQIRKRATRRRRSRALCDCYLALADLEDARPADALRRMAGLEFGRNSILNVMLYQNRAVCAHCLGDDATCDASLAALRELTDRYRNGSKRRALAERQLADLTLSLKPCSSWDAADAARAAERREAAESHRESVSWTLLLAEHELESGRPAAALELLDEKNLAPLTPRARERRAALLARLS